MRDLYELLGVDSDASKEEIEEAYRLRVVSTHRKGVWQLGDRFRNFQGAYEMLSDPERRAKYDTAREILVLKGEPGKAKARRDASQKARREGRIRSRYAKKRAHDSFRVGQEATLRNAKHMEQLVDEHDRIERAEHRARFRREIVGHIVRAVLFVAFVAGVIVLWLRS